MSTSTQVNYTKVCNKLTISKIRILFEYVFEQQILHLLREKCKKDGSAWSKKRVTVLLDDSIFKQWLSDQKVRAEEHYGKFFSGQHHTTVFGYQVVCFGIYIEDVFYPLFLDFAKASTSTTKKDSLRVAKKLVARWKRLVEKLSREGIELPPIHFSCDNGYNNKELSEEVEASRLIYISVPRKNNLFIIKGKQWKLSQYIEQVYLPKEQAEKEPRRAFTLRERGFYKSQKREVTLLFFRLNNSDKVSVIYSTSKTIFATTLRRHWFNRTYIEQFFKLLKHVLKISEARTRNRIQFEIKLLRFVWMGLELQKLVRYLRKKCKDFKKMGAISLQRILSKSAEFDHLLQSLV